MTDNDIIKALECCFVETDCTNCPCYINKPFAEDCLGNIAKQALNLIKRQQAEIERLKTFQINYMGYFPKLERDKAYEKFAEKLKKISCLYDLDNYHSFRAVDIEDIDDILKQLKETAS